jgi:hypothetical protein
VDWSFEAVGWKIGDRPFVPSAGCRANAALTLGVPQGTNVFRGASAVAGLARRGIAQAVEAPQRQSAAGGQFCNQSHVFSKPQGGAREREDGWRGLCGQVNLVVRSHLHRVSVPDVRNDKAGGDVTLNWRLAMTFLERRYANDE